MTGAVGAPDPWQNEVAGEQHGGPAYGEMVDAMRRLQDLVSGTNPPDDVVEALRDDLTSLGDLLQPWLADEHETPAGRRPDLPGRGHPLLLPLTIDEEGPELIRGRVRFTRYYLGGGGAAHGGTLPLLFDEVLGRLSNSGGRPRARTAYLHVNYRKITPIGPELQLEARVDREEGRKRYLTGRLLHCDELLADAVGLFVELLPGQP
jgi:acyl-coenzyme A thioesterase PaaI-like protein